MITQTGLAGPHQQGDEYEWDPRTGPSRSIVFVGTQTEIDGLLPIYQVAGNRLSRRSKGGGLFELRVSASSAMDGSTTTNADGSLTVPDSAVQIEWSLEGSDYEISIYKRMVQRLVPQKLVTYIESWVNDMRSDKTLLLNDAVAAVQAEAVGVAYSDVFAAEWLNLVLSGVESHRVSNFVVRKTITAPSQWVSAATPNVGKLYTFAQLAAEHLIPLGIAQDMPTVGYYLKATPRRNTVGNGKLQIQLEWQHAESFSARQYDLVL